VLGRVPGRAPVGNRLLRGLTAEVENIRDAGNDCDERRNKEATVSSHEFPGIIPTTSNVEVAGEAP